MVRFLDQHIDLLYRQRLEILFLPRPLRLGLGAALRVPGQSVLTRKGTRRLGTTGFAISCLRLDLHLHHQGVANGGRVLLHEAGRGKGSRLLRGRGRRCIWSATQITGCLYTSLPPLFPFPIPLAHIPFPLNFPHALRHIRHIASLLRMQRHSRPRLRVLTLHRLQFTLRLLHINQVLVLLFRLSLRGSIHCLRRLHLAPDGLALLDLHDFLHDSVLHQVVNLILVKCLPILHKLPQCLFQFDLQFLQVINLVIVISPQSRQNRQVCIEIPRFGFFQSVVTDYRIERIQVFVHLLLLIVVTSCHLFLNGGCLL